MNLEPHEDRILIRPWKEDKINGLHLPQERAKEKILMGQVIAIGPGRLDPTGALVPMKSAVGDTIMYDARSGLELRHESKTLLFLHDSQVVAFVRKGEPEPDVAEVDRAEAREAVAEV